MLDLDTEALAKLFLGMVADARPEVIMELGAYNGDFSLACRSILPDAAIHAFEANPVIHRGKDGQLRRAGVEMPRLAVGDRSGPAIFCIQRRIDGVEVSPKKGSNSLRRKPGSIEYEDIAVQMMTVDRFAKKWGLLGRSCALWIDLEGCAYEALTGAAKMLQTACAVLVEVEDESIWEGQKLASDVAALLMAADLAPVARDHEYGRQYNVIYARGGLLAPPSRLSTRVGV